MSAALETAIRYAERGWWVFPLKPGSKYPFKNFKWAKLSTNNIAKIRATATHLKYKGCNWALDTGKSGIFIIDVDMKKGKNGVDSLKKLPKPVISDMVVKTPSGGIHYYYTGVGKNSVEALGKGLDTRGVGGYVLIPGSSNRDGKPYQFSKKGDPDPLPTWILELIGKPSEKKEDHSDPITEFDQIHNVQRAISWLESSAPEALEGSGGDATTFNVACKMRDLGISETKAYELMLEYWNEEKASPPWSSKDLEKKVNNAYQYAHDRPGNDTPEAFFPDPPRSSNLIRSAAEITDKDVKPREWIMWSRYIRKIVTATVAPGGTGKSALTIVEGLAIASGITLTENEVKEKIPVWYYNTEDDFDELNRRIRAASVYHKLTKDDIKDFYFTSGRAQPLIFVKDDKKEGLVVNTKDIKWVITEIKRRNAGVFIIDPFIRCHRVNENDNNAIDLVIQQLQKISDTTNCAISVVHHVSKGATNVHGNIDKIRGASSLAGAVRIAHTFYTMGEKEGKKYGLTDKDYLRYSRLDNAKANFTPRTGNEQWYEHQSVPMRWDSDETVGTIAVSDIERVREESADKIITEEVINRVEPDKENLSIYAVSKLISDEGILGLKTRAIMRKILALFTIPLIQGGYVYKVVTDTVNNKEVKKITCKRIEEV